MATVTLIEQHEVMHGAESFVSRIRTTAAPAGEGEPAQEKPRRAL